MNTFAITTGYLLLSLALRKGVRRDQIEKQG